MTESRPRPDIALSFERGTLLLRGVPARELASAPGAAPWTWDARVGAWRCEAIHYRTLRDTLRRRSGPRLHDGVPRPVPVAWPRTNLPALRPEQREALDAWVHAGGRGQV